MGNDNIRKEIEKITQEINKEVRGKGKWIGDKYVYTPLHKETLYQKVILWVFVIIVGIVSFYWIFFFGVGWICAFDFVSQVWDFCYEPVYTKEWWVDKIGFAFSPFDIIFWISDLIGWIYDILIGELRN